jgi:hypothetical protein
MTPRTQVAYVAAGLVLVLGLLSLLNPALAMRLLGLELSAARGLSEVRSHYGALYVTMAALVLWALPLRPRTGPLLRTLGVLWLGAAAGRVASMVIDGLATPMNVVLLVMQLFIGGVLVWVSTEPSATRAEMRARRDALRARREAARAREEAARRAPTPAPGGEREPGRS